jgi:hypothetical protein
MLLRFAMLSVFHRSTNLLSAFGFVDRQPVILSMMLFFMVSQPVDSIVGWLMNVVRFEGCDSLFALTVSSASAECQPQAKFDR